MTPFWNACKRTDKTCGPAELSILEAPALTPALLKSIGAACKGHYVDRKWLSAFGRKSLAAKLATVLPKSKPQRSGDLGEILATEYINWNKWPYRVLILRLRWKDGRDLALRGDDVVGFDLAASPVGLLKAEAKSRVALSTQVLTEARGALKKNGGRPAAFVVSFIVQRLLENKQVALARRIDKETSGAALLVKRELANLIFVFSGSEPTALLEAHLTALGKGLVKQYGVGVHAPAHQKVIGEIYKEANRA
jgi:hypothetical protein